MNIDLGEMDFEQVFGGESNSADFDYENYGLQFEHVEIEGMNAKQAKQVAVGLVNHLITNGHQFEFKVDQMGVKELHVV